MKHARILIVDGDAAARGRLGSLLAQRGHEVAEPDPGPDQHSVPTVPDPAWVSDPASPNYVAPSLRDPNAARLLEAWPAPNTGTNQFQNTLPSIQDTRHEVLRLDWNINPSWRLMARYTHDVSETEEAGGLFFNTAIPNVATTITKVPGQVFVTQLTTTISSRMLNEFSFQFSGNAIKSEYGENARNTRSEYGVSIPELFPENREGLIPFVTVAGLTQVGANQLFDNKYRNFTFADNLSYVTGNHTLKGGFLIAIEQKDELSTSGTQGSQPTSDTSAAVAKDEQRCSGSRMLRGVRRGRSDLFRVKQPPGRLGVLDGNESRGFYWTTAVPSIG